MVGFLGFTLDFPMRFQYLGHQALVAFQLIKHQVNLLILPIPTFHSCCFHYEDFVDYHYFVNLMFENQVAVVRQKLNSVGMVR